MDDGGARPGCIGVASTTLRLPDNPDEHGRSSMTIVLVIPAASPRRSTLARFACVPAPHSARSQRVTSFRPTFTPASSSR